MEGRFYYVALLPLGLAVTGFLFGALRSFALYRGKHAGGALELGGPVVGFALVVIGGFVLPSPGSNFSLTVYVHGPAGKHDLPLRNEGAVLLDLGADRRREPIGDRGQAVFSEIPASFRGQTVNLAVDSFAFECIDPCRFDLNGPSVYLKAQRKRSRIAGNVVDEGGNPISGAVLDLVGLSTTSGNHGDFNLVIPPDRVANRMILRVDAAGYQNWAQSVIPNGGAITVVLRR